MSQSGADKRVRSGAKSCAECRRRKIRCVWSSTGDGISGSKRTGCDHCLAHGQQCIPQVVRPRASRDAGQTTARARIGQLEQEMASLAAVVRDRQTTFSGTPSVSGADNALFDELEGELDSGEIEGASPPSHLRLLFDNFEQQSPQSGASRDTGQKVDKLFASLMQVARAKLQQLLPSVEEVALIADFASDWMSLYYTLFPAFFAFRTGDQLVSNHERMLEQDVHPVELARYLLSIAITAQQVPKQSMSMSLYRGQGVTRFVDAVCRTVEHNIIGNNALVGTLEGLETAMLYVRLSQGRHNLKSAWLIFRRLVALAELIGLPQANEKLARPLKPQDNTAHAAPPQQDDLKLKADIWEAICASDRNYSMMLNFPAGTASYRFPRDESIFRHGTVSAQAYNYQLSNICAIVFEIDELYMREASDAECYEKILSADRRLRALASSAPKAWWLHSDGPALADILVKFWHNYILARVHLRPAMMSGSEQQYEYSRLTCRDACKNAVQYFMGCRSQIPSGFFVCRVLDVQAFTAAAFLLLSNRPDQTGLPVGSHVTAIVQHLIDCFASVSDQAGADLAREAREALTTLLAAIQGQNSDHSTSLVLQIPLLGKIHIGDQSISTKALNSTVEETTMPGPFEPQIDSMDGNLSLEDSGNNFVRNHADTPAEIMPMSWSFEFDDPSFWTTSSFLPEDW